MVSVMRIFRKSFTKFYWLSLSQFPDKYYIYSNNYNKNGFSPTFAIPVCFNFLIHCTAIDYTLIWHSFPDILGGEWESAKQFIIK